MMPEITLSVPILGNRGLIGIAFAAHLVVVAFIIGIAMIAPVAELLGTRPGGERWERLAHQLATIVERLFAWGATWAVFALVALYGLYPRLFGYLSSVFFWQLVVVGGLWFVMVLSAYGYATSWDRLRRRRWLHNALGWTFVVATFLFINLITQLSSFQLTPAGGPEEMLAAALNPSWPAEVIHRHIGNLSYGALLLAAYAAVWLLLFRGNEDTRSYHRWIADLLLLVGLGVTLLQPLAGWFYVRQIQSASPEAWARMMPGENGWMFLIQIGLLGTVFFLGNLHMVLGIGRGDPGPRTARWMRTSLWVIAMLVALAVVPKELPLGQMRPWKYLSLAGLVLFTLANLVLYIRVRRGFVRGGLGRGSQATLAGLGVAVVALMVVMGVIRESARGGDLIYKRMGPEQAQQIERP